MRRHAIRLTAALALTLAAHIPCAQAQDDDTTTTYDIGQTTVSATRTERAAITIPGDVIVIDRQAIDDSGARSVKDLLRGIAGLSQNTLGNPGSTDLAIHGFGLGQTGNLNVAVLIDGLRTNFLDLAAVDLTTIPLDDVERIEIRRGGGSTLYGNNATAGVINIITRRAEGRRLQAQVEVDSFGYSGGLALGWSDAQWSAMIQHLYEDSDGYRHNQYFRHNATLFSLAFTPVDSWLQLDLSAGIQRQDFGLPSGLTAAERATLGRRGTTHPGDYGDRESAYLNVTPTLRLNDENELRIGFGYRERRTYAVYQGYELEDRQLIYTLSPQWTNRTPIAGLPNTLTIGADLSYAELHAIKHKTAAEQTLLDLFIHDSLQILPDVFLDLGYRYGRAEHEFAGDLADPSEDLHAYTLGLAWHYRPDSKVFVVYDRSYRVPVLDEYTVYPAPFYNATINPDLRPQITYTLQGGIRHHLHDAFVPSLTISHIKTEDEVLYDPSIGFGGQNSNYDHTERLVVTAAVESRPTDWLELQLNYSWTDAEFGRDDDNPAADGKRLTMVPEHMVNGQANVSLPHGFTVGASAHWQSEQYVINDFSNRLAPIPEYILVGTRASWTWEWVTIYAGVDNLLDETYDEAGSANTSGTSIDFYPAAERSFYGGINVILNY